MDPKPSHNQKAIKCLSEDDAFFSSIGRFFFEFSQLEYSVRFTTAKAALKQSPALPI